MRDRFSSEHFVFEVRVPELGGASVVVMMLATPEEFAPGAALVGHCGSGAITALAAPTELGTQVVVEGHLGPAAFLLPTLSATLSGSVGATPPLSADVVLALGRGDKVDTFTLKAGEPSSVEFALTAPE